MSTSPAPRWNSPPPVYDSHSPAYSSATLKPYLQLPHLLSLTWLAYPILSLLFVVFRLQLSTASAQSGIASAKSDLLSSCTAAQKAATSAASMPRYLAVATNQQIADAVNATMDAARATMILALTIMEAIINFIIDMYRSTFLCFLELVVRGGLSLLIDAVQEINSFLQNTLGSIRTSIQNDVTSANSAIQSAVNGINKINPFGNITAPQLNVPSLSLLENVTLPTDFESALISLNNSLPTLSNLKSEIDSIVDTPFELVKKEINETFGNLTFDSSVLPVPEQNSLTFCSNLDTSVVDELGRDLVKVAKIGIVVLILLALLLTGANCALEWYKWRLLKQHLQNTRDAWTSDPTVYHASVTKTAPTVDLSDDNLLILQADSLHPHLMKIANALSALLRLSPLQYINLRWFLHYVFHPPALACFLIGFFGLLSVEIQIIAIRPLADKYSSQAVAAATGYTDLIATSINGSMYNQSSLYANQVNARVDAIQSTINDGLFGWVNDTTTTLNNTINAFYNDLQDAVSTVFNGTILESPVQEFIKCFIGSKVNGIEEALTFLHNNLNVDLPRVNESALVLSSSDLNEVTTPIASAAVGGGDDNGQGVLGELIAAYIKSLKEERIMFGIFMGLWGIVVLMALSIIFWHSYGRDWLEAHKRRKWQRKQRVGINGPVAPFRDRSPDFGTASMGGSMGGETMVQVDLPSFTPMPSPRPKPGLIDTMRSTTCSLSGTQAEDNLLIPPKHPLSMRNPAFEKSWDSFLDHADISSPPKNSATAKARASKKLMAVGRKAMGRERFVSDEEKSQTIAQAETVPESQSNVSWLTRVKDMFWKKDAGEVQEHFNEMESTQPKIRPQLMISTSHASAANVGGSSAIDHDTGEAALSSAWSVSPGPPPKLPWMNSVRPTKRLGLPSHPSHPKSRRTASVPSDVNSVYDSLSLSVPQAEAGTAVAVPLHYGFDHPQEESSLPRSKTLMPPPLHPTRQPMVNPNTSTPVTRLLTTIHARHSSQAVDPFVTPFDDENRVRNADVPTEAFSARSQPTNPFIAMAF
ncbi:hypothetical protein AcV5_006889 [Taiwanofungus camphoratus]|nr:hypothetical protein AcV5_006889 [Antrodia cinnamomea]